MQEQMTGGDIADLVQQMEQSDEDPRRCYALVKDRIRACRDQGRAVPDDLFRLERLLMTECLAESQGR